MNNLHHCTKTMGMLVLCCILGFSTTYSQIDSTVTATDSIHSFHRRKGDVINYLLVDNFDNPALAGSLKSYQAQASYGNYLPGSRNNRHYGNIMLDLFFGNKQGRHGLAYRMGMERMGFSTSIKQRIDYSFQVLNKYKISWRLGFGVGFVMDQHLPQNLTFGDMIDSRYGFVYTTQEVYSGLETKAFEVSRVLLNAGTQLRIYDGYLNAYYTNYVFMNIPGSGPGNGRYHGFGINALYNVQLKPIQLIPSLQFNYWAPELYLIQGGSMLASNTSKGGGGGITYNNLNILGITGLFAWNDYLRIYAQVQFPMSDIRMSYPVSNFQITVSYKVNDFGKYE